MVPNLYVLWSVQIKHDLFPLVTTLTFSIFLFLEVSVNSIISPLVFTTSRETETGFILASICWLSRVVVHQMKISTI